MFTIQYREEVREKIMTKAKSDNRIVSAAVIGSYASGRVDRWSDIDLTFGVDRSFTIASLLDSWTSYVEQEFSGKKLLDVKRGNSTYRVFILPGCLQLDLSFSQANEFGAMGKHFKLLYGDQHEKPQPELPSTDEQYGWLIHHLIRAKFSAERKRFWQAEFWLSEARDYALKLACLANGLNPDYGRGFDDLPDEILSLFKNSFVSEPNQKEISRVIKNIINALPNISDKVAKLSEQMRYTLSEL